MVVKKKSVSRVLTELTWYCAYDAGATDSGVHDPNQKRELFKALADLRRLDSYRVQEAAWFREQYLSDAALLAGYGLEDLMEFARWLKDA